MGTHARYISIVAGTVVFLAGLVLTVNVLVDPLWFFNGNRIGEQNARYNERYSKSNQFLKQPENYNCVILGSSTALLLDLEIKRNYSCFNYSFSQGHISEYVDFLRFVNDRTDTIELVVVSYDAYNLLESPFENGAKSAPPFVRQSSAPPNPIRAYLGLEPFFVSLKTLFTDKKRTGYYDHAFRAVLPTFADPYDPDEEAFDLNFRQRFDHTIGQFDATTLRHVEALKSAANGARVIGYVPPIAAHYIAFLHLEGELDSYLQSVYQASGLFDAFYDFTMPSAITRNGDHTIDGMHFHRAINDKIAETLAGIGSGFGVNPREHDFDAYRRLFVDATDDFLADARFLKDSGN